jgi:hypothetical protein
MAVSLILTFVKVKKEGVAIVKMYAPSYLSNQTKLTKNQFL